MPSLKLVTAAALLLACAFAPGTPEVIPVSGPPKVPTTRKEKIADRGTPERPNRSDTNVTESTLTVYALRDRAPTAFVVVCPGGGYSGLAIDKEGHDVARWLNSIGVGAAVLKYRVPPVRTEGELPQPVQDARDALKIIRARAKDLNVDPAHIGIMGFSAGGHLASTIATHDYGPDSHPAFAILGYPVITFDPTFAHMGSRKNLLGPAPTPAEVDLYSNEKQVTKNTPPIFIFHARDDKTVPFSNATAFVDACKKNNVPVEFVPFDTGGHGFGFGHDESAAWPDKCAAWLKARNLAP